jgi:hypothetical protein
MWSSAGPEKLGTRVKRWWNSTGAQKVAMGVLDSRAEWNLCDFVVNPAAAMEDLKG